MGNYLTCVWPGFLIWKVVVMGETSGDCGRIRDNVFRSWQGTEVTVGGLETINVYRARQSTQHMRMLRKAHGSHYSALAMSL